MKVKPFKTRIFREGENLPDFVARHIPQVKDDSVIAVASKIVALAEGRTAPISQKRRLIRAEGNVVSKTKYVSLTVKDGMFMADSGIDESNANGKLVLLPKDSFASAARLRKALTKHYRVKRLGVLITDSRTFPLRAGVTGVALGYAGFKGIRDYRGKRDIFKRKFKFSSTNVADSLASAATVVMGEGNERQPLAIIDEAPVVFSERISKKEGFISASDDMYLPLIRKRKRR